MSKPEKETEKEPRVQQPHVQQQHVQQPHVQQPGVQQPYVQHNVFGDIIGGTEDINISPSQVPENIDTDIFKVF
jgi:hypothetical protein